jgi:hypothetical protein
MIRRISLTAILGAAAAATLITGAAPGALTNGPHVSLAALALQSPNPPPPPRPPVAQQPAVQHPAVQRPAARYPGVQHPGVQHPVVLPPGPLRAAGQHPGVQHGYGPGWDGNHGRWDDRSGFGHGGGWDGVGGGWDGNRWWVSPQRCVAGHGHVVRNGAGPYCRGGIFNGAPIHF